MLGLLAVDTVDTGTKTTNHVTQGRLPYIEMKTQAIQYLSGSQLFHGLFRFVAGAGRDELTLFLTLRHRLLPYGGVRMEPS